MFTACFDAAGKVGDKATPIVAVAGFCSVTSVWAEFDQCWSDVLKRYDLLSFHSGDFARFKPPFESFRHDEKRRRRLLSDLLDVIHRLGLRKCGAFIEQGCVTQAGTTMKLQDGSYLDEYVACARYTIDNVRAYARGEGSQALAVIFEKGDSEDLLRKHLRRHNLPEAEFRWAKSHTDRKGIKHTPFLGLQAAGWLAWEVYVDACRTLSFSDHRPTDEGRDPFKEFMKLPGEILILYAKNPIQRISQMVWQQANQHFNAARESIEPLRQAAEEKK